MHEKLKTVKHKDISLDSPHPHLNETDVGKVFCCQTEHRSLTSDRSMAPGGAKKVTFVLSKENICHLGYSLFSIIFIIRLHSIQPFREALQKKKPTIKAEQRTTR